MKMSDNLSSRSELIRHKDQMKKLQTKHETEIDKIKQNHHIKKNDLKNQHSLDTANLKNTHEMKLIERAEANKKVFDRLETSINTVKSTVEKQREELEANHSAKTKNLNLKHEIDYSNAKERNNLQLEDLNQQANIDIQKLQRNSQALKQDLAHSSQKEIQSEKDMALDRKELTKDAYFRKQNAQEAKYARALYSQNSEHTKILTTDEKKHQDKMQARGKLYNEIISSLDEDGREKIQTNQKNFEKDFNRLWASQEKVLKSLVGKKDQIIDNLREELIKEYTIGVEKNEDPFYNFAKIETNLSEDNQGNYILKIPISKHEANKVSLSAYDREIKIQMERRFEFEKGTDESKSSVNKVESYVSKIPVAEILNPKSIEKSYHDGMLSFKIKKA